MNNWNVSEGKEISKLTYVSSSFVLKMVKVRVETPSVKLFDESSKKLARQKGKVSKLSEVESKVQEEVRKVSEAKKAK